MPICPFRPVALLSVPLCLVLNLVLGCAGSTKVDDPIRTLQTPEQPGRVYLAAMAAADRNPDDEAYRQALRRIVVSPNYVAEARRAAYSRLYESHRDALKATLEINLPKLEALEWRTELCERIAADRWMEMTPTLIRAWAQWVPAWAQKGKDRPERKALVAMYGDEQVVNVLLKEMAEANPITQANLRARCWELLLLEGQEARLRQLLAEDAGGGRDAMMLDLRAAVTELGILPRNREEIIWVRSLRDPSRRAFWDAAVAALAQLPAERRERIELRDLPVVVTTVATHRDRLTADDAALDSAILERLGGPKRRVYSPDFEGHEGSFSERFEQHRKELTWGDRTAILLALDAMDSPDLRAHLFEAGDQDLADRACEHGGLIDRDSRGRYEYVPYPSVTRGNDARYEATQDLMEALYTGLFHVHFHCQAYDSRRYAGPHMGDFGFADANRRNGLLFTFVSDNRLNVDFYRYGRVVVDLGTIERP